MKHRVIVLDDNLFLRPRIESSLIAAGYEVRFLLGKDEFDGALAENPVALLVNLASEKIPWAELVGIARTRLGKQLAIVGFGPHTDRRLFEEALDAGCTEAVPNGLVVGNAASVINIHVAQRS